MLLAKGIGFSTAAAAGLQIIVTAEEETVILRNAGRLLILHEVSICIRI